MGVGVGVGTGTGITGEGDGCTLAGTLNAALPSGSTPPGLNGATRVDFSVLCMHVRT